MYQGAVGCRKSSSGERVTAAITMMFAVAIALHPAVAQTVDQPPTVDEVKTALGPAIEIVAWPFALLAKFFWVITRYSSIAILLSAVSAGTFALVAMRHQAATARLRETFVMLNRDNWDKDVIESRVVLRTIINELGKQRGSISKYAADSDLSREPANVPFNMMDARKDFLRKKITLLTIMNDYENIALGIKHGILDESFLFQWMRSTLIRDWSILSPLVYEYRQMSENSQVYIEFEGLASQWSQELSYRTGRKLTKSKRRVWIG